MARLAKALAGNWNLVEVVQNGTPVPEGAGRRGQNSVRLVGGGTALVDEGHTVGTVGGDLRWFSTFWWDAAAQRYRLLTCFRTSDDAGCELRGTARWEAGQFINEYRQSVNGTPTKMEDRWTDITQATQQEPSAYGGCMLRSTQLNHAQELELNMKKPAPAQSASALIDERIKELGDWRGQTLAKVRAIIHAADPEIVEEWKWMGTPIFSHGGIICTGETYKNVVKLTFAKGAALKDPSGLFNSSLDGNVRRAIDIHEGDKLDAAALQDLIRAAATLNLKGKSKSKPRRASSTRAD